ncbi:galactose-3-O-sulfotransferase 3-like isoform X3 [Planococcus citri]|uniref:galactose-3-O-sulfotransferase 3-like isoform X3 n=1 Tax=Planococcus citri TaxID=170843 RepID=UPI0031F8262C
MCLFVKKARRRLSCLLNKRVIILSSICISILILLGILLMGESLLSKPIAYKCCTPTNNNHTRTNVYFLKTHKTGGTSVQSVIIRFAIMNSLDIMIFNFKSYYLPISNSSLYPPIIPPNYKFHVFASHARYDSNMKLFQYPDTSMVTILRHPATLFRSLYTFFRMDISSGMTFQEFLNAPVKPAVVTGFDNDIAYKGYNQMSVDLGFDLENTNLMGWPLEYVASLKLNGRLPGADTYPLTKQDELTLMDLNHVDTQLYNYFHEKFLRCKRQYGEDNLNRQVEKLQIINENFQERCVAEEVIRLNKGSLERIEYVAKNKSDKYGMCLFDTGVSCISKNGS